MGAEGNGFYAFEMNTWAVNGPSGRAVSGIELESNAVRVTGACPAQLLLGCVFWKKYCMSDGEVCYRALTKLVVEDLQLHFVRLTKNIPHHSKWQPHR